MRSFFCAAIALALAVPSWAQRSQAGSISLPVDWSSRHILHNSTLDVGLARAAVHDPRVLYNWLLRHAGSSSKGVGKKGGRQQVDWHFPLGNGTVPPSMSPAKYTLLAGSGTLTAANCTSDYLVYGLNTIASASQPDLVRFNNIYAGTGGVCGANPTVQSPYVINTLDNSGLNPLNGVIKTSPALSIDGLKLAFVETVTGTTRT